MLTRPGSNPGPEWMRKLGGNAVDLRQPRNTILRIIVLFVIVQVTAPVIADIAVYLALGKHVQSYNSSTQIAGMPLLSVGGIAHGVIAYGGVATGIVAIGGVTAGVIAFGGVSVGVISFGGLSIGVLVLAGVTFGWRAVGAVAVGHAALGSLAIGRYAYAGPGVALGHHEASGNQKESLIG
jgi:hypothetical protein